MENKDYQKIFEKVFSMSSDGFILTDEAGIVIDINEQYADFLGVPREEIIGFHISKTISNTNIERILAEKVTDVDMIHTYEDGKAKGQHAIVSRAGVEDENGRTFAYVSQAKFRLNSLDVANKLMSEYSELEYYREAQSDSAAHIIGSSPVFKEIFTESKKIANTDFSVLLTGETGTGKEVFARYLHDNSPRRNKPFVGINCAAIPSELLESELFGYMEGSFTGAKKGGKKGKFLLANNGTVFLDEIGDMPLPMQVKLLRVLQERELEPVGAEKTIPVNIRIIAATRRNLEQMIIDGTFREDLYYRLNVVNIKLPPLRSRGRDILELANYFLNQLNVNYKAYKRLSKEVETALLQYHWPGNVRELENGIQSAFAVSEGPELQLQDFPQRMLLAYRPVNNEIHKTLHDMVEDYEKMLLKDFIERNHHNYSAAAKEAGIHRSLFYKKLAKYDLKK